MVAISSQVPIKARKSLLAFGLLTAFTSSIGQTFFLAFFVPFFMRDFRLTAADFGYLYSLSSLCAAGGLLFLGPRVNSSHFVERFTLISCVVMALASFAISNSSSWFVLFISVFALRLCGQGLLSHISATVMAKEFVRGRGKALAFASLGYALGEALLPGLLLFLIEKLGWRSTMTAGGLSVVCLLMPGAIFLLRNSIILKAPPVSNTDEVQVPIKVSISFRDLLQDFRFILLLPCLLMFPMIGTALFLYQVAIFENNNWPLHVLPAAFATYSIVRASVSVLVGVLIDRVSATRIFPIVQIPTILAIGLCIIGGDNLIAFSYMIFLGISAGMSGNVVSAMWAELYGGNSVAKIRSLTSSLSVFAAALTPALVSLLLQSHFNQTSIMSIAMVLSAISTVLAFIGLMYKSYRHEPSLISLCDTNRALEKISIV